MTHEAKEILLFSCSQVLDGKKGIKITDQKHHCFKCGCLYLLRLKIKAVTCANTCFWDALSLLFRRSTSEPGLKEDERSGPEPLADLSFGGLWASGVRILGKVHLWSSILEPWKWIRPISHHFYLDFGTTSKRLGMSTGLNFAIYHSLQEPCKTVPCQLLLQLQAAGWWHALTVSIKNRLWSNIHSKHGEKWNC